MEFSARLSKVTEVFIKDDLVSDVAAFVEKCGGPKGTETRIAIQGKWKAHSVRGTGQDVHFPLAVAKALSEFGEGIILNREFLDNTSGLAGGLTKHAAMERARAEILEREAFFYHYRNRIPFLRMIEDLGEMRIYEMAGVDPIYSYRIAIDARAAEGKSDCLIFGLGVSLVQIEAKQKAGREFSGLMRQHRMQPNWCRDAGPMETEVDVMDFHHFSSRDSRNRKIFQELCAIEEGGEIRRPHLDRQLWHFHAFESPLRGFSYFLASHPQTIKLGFSTPEPGTENSVSPLYHPFW